MVAEQVTVRRLPFMHPDVQALVEEVQAEYVVRYGGPDGSPIDPDALAAIRAVLRQESRAHAWRKGDVLVLDNMLSAHGRRPFTLD